METATWVQALNRKTLEASLIKMTFACHVVVSVVSHCVRPTDPLTKSPHFAIDKWTQHQMPMPAHDLVRVKFDLVKLQRFMKNFLESNEITGLAKNLRT